MTALATDIQRYFQPILGTKPWRVKPGVGSFLTFEFGPRTKENGHIHGKWHLWIYLSNWALFHDKRQLADSDTDRKIIATAARRLEKAPLTGIKWASRAKTTTFLFDDYRLLVSPVDYLENVEDRDSYWIFFMPDNEVLTMGPSGLSLEQGSSHSSPGSRRSQEENVPSTDAPRQIRFHD